MRVLIIGAGIHGLTSAIALAKEGYEVIIVDKNSDIFQGTSGATHNRAHMGYHYPRSLSTGKECLEGLEDFRKKYSGVIVDQKESFYMIEKSSQTSMDEYRNFCGELDIPFRTKWPSEKFIRFDLLQGSIVTSEPIFNIPNLKNILEREAKKEKITIITDFEVLNFQSKKENYLINGYWKTRPFNIFSDIILNATYSYSNNILKILDLEEDFNLYNLQHTEIVVVKTSLKLPSITIMDGPFVSIMKHGITEDEYLLYDVKNSTHEEEKGYFVEEKKFKTNFLKMKDHFKKYFLFVDDLEYVDSWWGTRPVPVEIRDDSRNTRIKEHKKYTGIYSILEGKFISATLIADQFVSLLNTKI